MAKIKTIKLLVPFTEDQIEKIDRMMSPLGTIDRTNTIRAAVSFAHLKLFKDYIEIQRTRVRDPIEKAKATVLAKELVETEKQNSEMRKQESICLLMDESEVISHPDTGRPSCKYPVFTTASPHKVDKTWYTEDLTLMNEETPALQYHDLFGRTGPEGKANVLEIIAKMDKPPE